MGIIEMSEQFNRTGEEIKSQTEKSLRSAQKPRLLPKFHKQTLLHGEAGKNAAGGLRS